MANYTSSGEVQFNEALAVVQRLNELQTHINMHFSNLLAIDSDMGDISYKLAFRDLNSMLAELSQDLTDEELNEARRVKEILHRYISAFPVIEENNSKFNLSRDKKQLNHHSLKMIELALHEYRYLLNKYKKKHGYSNPEVLDPKRAIVNN